MGAYSMRHWKMILAAFLILLVAPIGVSAASYFLSDRASGKLVRRRPVQRGRLAGRVSQSGCCGSDLCGAYSTLAWHRSRPFLDRVKEKGASRCSRCDYTAWGEPIRVDGFVADGRWFGQLLEEVFRADGERAALLILKIRAAIDGYKHRNLGDYRAWPGPNSNTFVAAIIDAVPEMQVVLPPTAIGKDFPTTASGSGGRLPAQVCEPRLEVISASLSGGWKVSNSMCWGPSLVSIFAVLRSRFRVSAGLA
jgi:hypothetical protein